MPYHDAEQPPQLTANRVGSSRMGRTVQVIVLVWWARNQVPACRSWTEGLDLVVRHRVDAYGAQARDNEL